MKKSIVILMLALLCTAVLLSSCSKDSGKGDASGDPITDSTAESRAEDTTDKKPEDTAYSDNDNISADTDENGYLTLKINSESDIPDINQMLDYNIDHVDLSEYKPGAGGDITGIWFSSVLKVQMELDNNPETVEYMSYRAAFSFRSDGTAKLYISMGGNFIDAKYTVSDNGRIDISGEGISLPNAKYTVSDDGQYLLFESDTLTANFMKVN